MPLQALYTAVDNELLGKLKKLKGDELFDELESIQYSRKFEVFCMRHSWDALHFVLTNEPARDKIENNEFSEFIMGTTILVYDHHFISYSSKEDVERILKKIEKIDITDYYENFKPDIMNDKRVYPGLWKSWSRDNLFEHLEFAFERLISFYKKNGDLNIVVGVNSY